VVSLEEIMCFSRCSGISIQRPKLI